ncbi:uncharacterized protein LOC112573864 isoform X2 [Pomacea canaliculata]|uniref:uncharacterized protein LOC112573864 isoform X2 n=1 Tax=Pomacea canaliculata TaxID=400727 RepID=UPI000D72646D|nr:uncharacterized protein LOC112573864 isoform X2 [Pomacea canaliculata]
MEMMKMAIMRGQPMLVNMGCSRLECPAGSVIRINRANYGRFSLKLCNPQGRTENMDVTCQNVKTTDIVSSECDGHQRCEFLVNNDIFEDPCPGTSKYIEVRHHCSPVSSVPVPENVRVCQRLYETGFISWSMPRDGASTVYNKFKLKLRKVNETVTEEREINLGNPENGRYIYELGSDVLSTEFALKAATADGGWGDYSPFVRPETCPIPPEIAPKTSSRSYVPVPRNTHVCQHHLSSNSVSGHFLGHAL